MTMLRTPFQVLLITPIAVVSVLIFFALISVLLVIEPNLFDLHSTDDGYSDP